MPLIATFDEHPPLVAVKTYRLIVTVTLKASTGKCSVSSRIEYSGLAYGDDCAAEVVYSTLCHARNRYAQRAVIVAGNVEFGPVHMGIMPAPGEYVNGQLVSKE